METGIVIVLLVVLVLGIMLLVSLRDSDDSYKSTDTHMGRATPTPIPAPPPVIKKEEDTHRAPPKPDGHYVSLYAHTPDWSKRCPYCDAENSYGASSCQVCGKSI